MFQKRHILFLFLLITVSCGESTTPNMQKAASDCTTGQAVIGVYDGTLQTLCGCSEGVKNWDQDANPILNCTISKGTELTFQYIGTKLVHQILSQPVASTDLTFVSSPLSNPNVRPVYTGHTVVIDTLGTYPYIDAIQPQLQGNVIVQ